MTLASALYVGIAGVDGAGKSTLAAHLCSELRRAPRNAILYDDGRNFVAEIATTIARSKGLRSGRMWLGEDSYNIAIAFQYLQRAMVMVEPFLSRGIDVVTSRTHHDWLAGARARGRCTDRAFAAMKEILDLCPRPDVLIWLDTAPELARRRIIARGEAPPELAYLEAYRSGFREVLSTVEHHVVSGDDKPNVVLKSCWSLVSNRINLEEVGHGAGSDPNHYT